ncbi:MAG: beta-N-acetylhexosaminidase family protein [Planctomycetota bacterium]|jgi:hypothetical protein
MERQGPIRILHATALAAIAVLALPSASARAEARAGREARLASGGRALVPVVVGAKASERTRAAAGTLAEYLGRISGAEFAVETGAGRTGIAVGLLEDFPRPPIRIAFAGGPFSRERYILRSHRGGVWLVGATEVAVEHAVWDLLHRLGYRQFFPGGTWEVVPKVAELRIAVDADESPDFHARRIWYNCGCGGATA